MDVIIVCLLEDHTSECHLQNGSDKTEEARVELMDQRRSREQL